MIFVKQRNGAQHFELLRVVWNVVHIENFIFILWCPKHFLWIYDTKFGKIKSCFLYVRWWWVLWEKNETVCLVARMGLPILDRVVRKAFWGFMWAKILMEWRRKLPGYLGPKPLQAEETLQTLWGRSVQKTARRSLARMEWAGMYRRGDQSWVKLGYITLKVMVRTLG